MPLVIIPEDHEQYFSDGSGMRSKSNMGVQDYNSEHNSDSDEEESHSKTRHKIASAKQLKSSSKEPRDKSQQVS